MNRGNIYIKKASGILRHFKKVKPAKIGITLLIIEVLLLLIYTTLNLQTNIPLVLAIILCIMSIILIFYSMKHTGKY